MSSTDAAPPAGARSDNQSCRNEALAALADITRAELGSLARLAGLAAVVRAERALAECRRRLVVDLMLDPHATATWGDVGRTLGISRQAARQGYDAHVVGEMRRRSRARMTE